MGAVEALPWWLEASLGAEWSPARSLLPGRRGSYLLQGDSGTILYVPAWHLLQEECREATKSFYGVSASYPQLVGNVPNYLIFVLELVAIALGTPEETGPAMESSWRYSGYCFVCCFFYILFIYSWDTHTEKDSEIQAEGEAGSMQGAWCGTDPGLPGSHPGLKVALNRWATRAALMFPFFQQIYVFWFVLDTVYSIGKNKRCTSCILKSSGQKDI